MLLFGKYFVDEDLAFWTGFVLFILSMGLSVVAAATDWWVLYIPFFLIIGSVGLAVVWAVLSFFWGRWAEVFRKGRRRGLDTEAEDR